MPLNQNKRCHVEQWNIFIYDELNYKGIFSYKTLKQIFATKHCLYKRIIFLMDMLSIVPDNR